MSCVRATLRRGNDFALTFRGIRLGLQPNWNREVRSRSQFKTPLTLETQLERREKVA